MPITLPLSCIQSLVRIKTYLYKIYIYSKCIIYIKLQLKHLVLIDKMKSWILNVFLVVFDLFKIIIFSDV